MLISFLLFLLFTSSQVKAGEAPKTQDDDSAVSVPSVAV